MAQLLQHWSVTCTTCYSPAEYHCNTCGDILCPRCREIHQRSRGTGHHSIVPYAERVEPSNVAGHCDNHPGKKCKVWCQVCDKAACTQCVTSDEHRRHIFVQLASKVDEQKKIIREDFQNFSKLLKPWEDSLRQIQGSLTTYQNDVDELGKEIARAADMVCDQVRATEAALQKQLNEIKTSQLGILHDKETVLQNGIAEIKQQIKTAEDKLRSEDIGDLLQYRTQEKKAKSINFPDIIPPILPTFTSGKLDIQTLEAMLGDLSIASEKYREKDAGKSTTLEINPKSNETGNIASHKDLSQSSSSTSTSISSKISLLPEVTVMSTIQTDQNVPPYLACSGPGQAWVTTGSNKLELMDRQGKVKKTHDIDPDFMGGMAISPLGYILFSGKKVIKSVSEKGSIKTCFRTKWDPYGICVAENEDVVVAFCEDGRVVRYSVDGKVMKELDKSLFRCPRNVAKNMTNKHLYVCDKITTKSDSPGKILAVDDATGSVLYEYIGLDDTIFTPVDVCTDQTSHVIVTDYSNNRIHILDQKCKFLQYLLTKDQGLYKPLCIDIDTDGNAWVGEYECTKRSQVKLLKYLNDP